MSIATLPPQQNTDGGCFRRRDMQCDAQTDVHPAAFCLSNYLARPRARMSGCQQRYAGYRASRAEPSRAES